jgi:hypothetical protein
MPDFTPVPDTRTTGTGSPAADMDSTADELVDMGASFNVLNATYAGGADATGAADSTAAIQAALNATAAGTAVLIPLGTYKTGSPLTIPDGVRLYSLTARSLGISTGNYGAGGLPLLGAILKPSSSFSGAAVITMGSAGTTQHGGQQIYGITIDGSSLPAGSVHGIASVGYVGGVTLRDVLVYGVTGDGLNAANDGTAGHNPDFWDVAHCKFSHCGGWGMNTTGLSDSWFTAGECTGNTSGGAQVTNGSDSRYTAWRCESNATLGTTPGWSLIGASGFTGIVTLTACAADLNGVGVASSGTGTGTYILNGIVAHGNTTQWTYAGTNTIHSSAAWNTSTVTPTFS